MSDIPETVRILGYIFNVVVLSDRPQGDCNVGSCSEYRQLIEVSPMGPDAMRETFLHEVVHACEQGASLELEESQIHAMSRLLYSFLRDNPAAVAWLMDR